MPTHDRAAENWPARLSGPPPGRDESIQELRQILVRGLRKSLGARISGGLQVEDIVQEALLKILDSLDSFAGRSRFTTWAMTIATRVGISELRRKRYSDVSLDAITSKEDVSFPIAIDQSPTAADAHQRQRILEALRDLIAEKLTAKQRQAIQALLGGLPIEEIASRTGSNRNAVYKLIHDARVRLKDELESMGIEAQDIQTLIA